MGKNPTEVSMVFKICKINILALVRIMLAAVNKLQNFDGSTPEDLGVPEYGLWGLVDTSLSLCTYFLAQSFYI